METKTELKEEWILALHSSGAFPPEKPAKWMQGWLQPFKTFHCTTIRDNTWKVEVNVWFNLYLYLRDHWGTTLIYNDIESVTKTKKRKNKTNPKNHLALLTTSGAVTVGLWDVSESGVIHQLCGSHVIFLIQMVCQMQSCQSSDREHTLPAYKNKHIKNRERHSPKMITELFFSRN